MADRDDEMAKAYMAGDTLRECAVKFRLTMQRVHQILVRREDVKLRAPYIRKRG